MENPRYIPASGARGKRDWWVHDTTDPRGGLEDKRGRFRTFGTREAAQAAADKANRESS